MTTLPSAALGSMSPVSRQRSLGNAYQADNSTPGALSITDMDSVHIGTPSVREIAQNISNNYLKQTTECPQNHSQDRFQSSSEAASDLPLTTASNSESNFRTSAPKETQPAKTSLASLKLDGKQNIIEFRDHINQGLALIRDGKYEDAVEHFRDKQALRNIGYILGRGEYVFSTKIPTSPDMIRKLVDQYATKSMCMSDQKIIHMAKIEFMPPGNFYGILEPQDSTEQEAVKQIRHEEALVHAEENLHALQNVLGHNIAYSEPGNEDDYEIDIAATFAEENVPMTENFLKRYGRDQYVKV